MFLAIILTFVESITEKIKNPKEVSSLISGLSIKLSYRCVTFLRWTRFTCESFWACDDTPIASYRVFDQTIIGIRAGTSQTSSHLLHDPSRTRLGVLFSAWHQRILLVTEQACAVIVWEIRRRGNDRSQNGYEVAVQPVCLTSLPKQHRHLMRLTRNASRDSYRNIAACAA